MREAILKIRYFKRGLSKNLNKVKLIFSFVPGNVLWVDYENQNEAGTSLSLFRKNIFLVICHLGNYDDLIQSDF